MLTNCDNFWSHPTVDVGSWSWVVPVSLGLHNVRSFGRGSSDQSWCWNLVRLPPREKGRPINEPTIVNSRLTSSTLRIYIGPHRPLNTSTRGPTQEDVSLGSRPTLGGNPTLSEAAGVVYIENKTNEGKECGPIYCRHFQNQQTYLIVWSVYDFFF